MFYHVFFKSTLSLCVYVHLESFSIPSSYLRNDCTLSNLPIVAEDDKIINELAGSWKFHIQFPSLTQSSCMTLAKSRNVSVTQFLICALTMRKNEAFLFISLKKHLYCHTCQVHPDPQHTYWCPAVSCTAKVSLSNQNPPTKRFLATCKYKELVWFWATTPGAHVPPGGW